MTVQEAARNVMKVTGTTQTMVAERAGLYAQSAVAMYLKSKSMRVDALLAILNACGYELVARSGDGKHPEFVIGENLSEETRKSEMDRIAEMVRKTVMEEIAKSYGQEDKDGDDER